MYVAQTTKKIIPHSCQYEDETMWWPCLIATSSTCGIVLYMVLVNWKWLELTNNYGNGRFQL